MVQYGIVSILPRMSPQAYSCFEHLYSAIGLNTGNLLFTNAVWHQLDGTKRHLGYTFDTEEVNDSCDALVRPPEAGSETCATTWKDETIIQLADYEACTSCCNEVRTI